MGKLTKGLLWFLFVSCVWFAAGYGVGWLAAKVLLVRWCGV